MQTLFTLRIVRPTLVALRVNQLTIYPQYVVPAEDDGLNRFAGAVSTATLSEHFKRWALFDVCATVTIHGVPFCDVTPESFHYVFETRESAPRTGLHVGQYVGHSAW